MRRPRAILFDHDGVLVASEPLHWAAWGKLLKEIGIPYVEAEMRKLIGKTSPQMLTWFLDKYRPGWKPADHDLDALALRKNDHYLASMATELKVYPGVREGLVWMRENGLRAGVVSNAKGRELKAALDVLELAPLMDVIICRDDAPAPKPDPAPYLKGASSLGFAPAECMAVEDSPPGLAAGLRAMMPSAAVMTNFNRAALEAPVAGRPELRPVWIGASMVDFFAWIRGLPVCG